MLEIYSHEGVGIDFRSLELLLHRVKFSLVRYNVFTFVDFCCKICPPFSQKKKGLFFGPNGLKVCTVLLILLRKNALSSSKLHFKLLDILNGVRDGCTLLVTPEAHVLGCL